MLVVMNANATEAEIAGVVRVIEALGATRTAIGITGNKGAISLQHFENLPGVAEAIRVSKPYKLITLDLKQDRTIVDIGGAKIGNGSLAMIAGPCAIETRQQTSPSDGGGSSIAVASAPPLADMSALPRIERAS